MPPPPNFEEFVALIANTFFVEPNSITRSTTAKDVTGWDSISHLILIATIEEVYSIRFQSSELQGVADVGGLFDKTAQLIGTRGA
jgi:acyl carrier protein